MPQAGPRSEDFGPYNTARGRSGARILTYSGQASSRGGPEKRLARGRCKTRVSAAMSRRWFPWSEACTAWGRRTPFLAAIRRWGCYFWVSSNCSPPSTFGSHVPRLTRGSDLIVLEAARWDQGLVDPFPDVYKPRSDLAIPSNMLGPSWES
ncbi:hypothetical protein VUR80DRAFT_7294 [Thermomyces stellatus]